MGQVRDCFGFFGEARIGIYKPTWGALNRGKAATAAIDPGRENVLSPP
jgi:hypothetical protein